MQSTFHITETLALTTEPSEASMESTIHITEALALTTEPSEASMESTSSYYNSSSVCVCVPYLLRGPLPDLRQTWWVYVDGPRNCP